MRKLRGEKAQRDLINMYKYLVGLGIKKRELGSSQWCLATGQDIKRTSGYQDGDEQNMLQCKQTDFIKKKKILGSHTPVANSLSKQKSPRVKRKAPLALGDDITQQHDITISISEKKHPSVQNWYNKVSGHESLDSHLGNLCEVTSTKLQSPGLHGTKLGLFHTADSQELSPRSTDRPCTELLLGYMKEGPRNRANQKDKEASTLAEAAILEIREESARLETRKGPSEEREDPRPQYYYWPALSPDGTGIQTRHPARAVFTTVTINKFIWRTSYRRLCFGKPRVKPRGEEAPGSERVCKRGVGKGTRQLRGAAAAKGLWSQQLKSRVASLVTQVTQTTSADYSQDGLYKNFKKNKLIHKQDNEINPFAQRCKHFHYKCPHTAYLNRQEGQKRYT
ncbi:hypothetical protein QYF61_013631 [Mycteria americana]|uniref:Uncharacterized protein n=1 Tax=Mycteria americana TaxID=33587 RepID=A0AAN7MUA0_MYCAM|nr:hypothetical protein QYF61_013631 [Mycteria americana]